MHESCDVYRVDLAESEDYSAFMKSILSIQYLRALAALAVVLFHQHWMELERNAFPVGAAGVDLFFVISGFIMFTVTEKKETSPKDFIVRRLIRIVPLYWAATMLTLLVGLAMPWWMYNSLDLRPSHLLASLFFIPHVAVNTHTVPTVTQGWSLNIEMFFYALFAGTLFFPRRFQLPLLSVLMTGIVIVGAIFPLKSAALDLYAMPMLGELVAGMWIGQFWAWQALPGRKAGFVLLVIGTVAFCFQQALSIDVNDMRPNIPAVLLVIGALCIEADGGVIASRPLKVLGDASYSIYLIHELVIYAVKRMHILYPFSIVAGVMTTVTAGIILYEYFEKPLLYKIQVKFFSTRQKAS